MPELIIARLGRGLLAPTIAAVPATSVTVRSASDSGLGDQKTVTPGSIVNGDTVVLVAWYLNENPSTAPGSVTCTPPASFTSRLKSTYNFTSAGAVANLQINVEVFTKAASSESGDYTVTVGNNDAGAAAYTNLACIVCTGASATTPVAVTSTNSGGPSSSSGTATATSVFCSRSTALLLWVFGGYDTSAALPSGMSAQVTDLDGVNAVATQTISFGSTGNKTATIAGESIQQNGWVALLVALQS